MGLIPASGRSPGRGHSNSLQYSCLENSTDRAARQARVHRVPESDRTKETARMPECLIFLNLRFFHLQMHPLFSIWKWKKVLVAQSFPTLCDPIDCSLPVSSIHGVLQAKILDWTAIPFSRGSSWLKDWTQVFCITDILYHPRHQGSPI